MKIRNGFVSNSSSSSFVVVFPRKPESAEDVFEFMFNSSHDVIPDHYHDDYSRSTFEIAEDVWNDIKAAASTKYDEYSYASACAPATKEAIVNEFGSRYYYNHGNIINMQDGFGSPGQFYMRDRELTKKLEKLTIELEALDKKQSEEMWRAKEAAIGPQVRYAGIDSSGKKYGTDEEIKAYEEYKKKEKKYYSTSKCKKQHEAEREKHWDLANKIDELKKKVAEIDAEAFMNAHKGKFIFIISYGDDGLVGCFMEHSDIFRNVPHETISHH